MSKHADILITHAHLFTLQGTGVGYVADGAVAITGDRVAAVGPTAELNTRFRASEEIDAAGCAVLPGLIDAHIHTPWALVRGVAQDVAHWMQRALAPYSRHFTPEAGPISIPHVAEHLAYPAARGLPQCRHIHQLHDSVWSYSTLRASMAGLSISDGGRSTLC